MTVSIGGATISGGVNVGNYIPIVTTGLIGYWDAGNASSYPGSGTNWLDLSGNNNTASAGVFPTYSSGGFIFDGTTSGLNLNSYSSPPTNNFTYEMFCIPNATRAIETESTTGTGGTGGQKYIIGAAFQNTEGGAGVSIGTNGVSVYEHGAGYMPPLLVDTTAISNSVATQVAIVYTNKQPSLYINGTLIRTGLQSTKNLVYATGSTIGFGSYGYYSGTLYIMRYYNRSLNSNEVNQNFQAQRGRFSI